MGILRRVKELFLAETNGLIDKCEQPLNMVNQYMREFDQELAKGQKALANQLFIERRQEYKETRLEDFEIHPYKKSHL
jgi:phage shock protein A